MQILLASGADKLEWYAPSYLGVDVRATIDDALRVRALAAGHDVTWLDAFPRDSLPTFRWLPTGTSTGPNLESGPNGP